MAGTQIVSPAADILAIETSSRRASLALRIGGEVVSTDLAAKRAHASDMLPRLETLLREAGHAAPGLPPLDGIVVGTGPGSYTGLRVGIATALGLARANDVPLRGVPSFEALALARLLPQQVGAVVLDARAGRFYFARYRREQDEVTTLIEPRAVRATELRALLADDEVILGEENLEETAGISPAVAERVRTGNVPHASDLLVLGAERLRELGAQDVNAIEPLYLRTFGE